MPTVAQRAWVAGKFFKDSVTQLSRTASIVTNSAAGAAMLNAIPAFGYSISLPKIALESFYGAMLTGALTHTLFGGIKTFSFNANRPYERRPIDSYFFYLLQAIPAAIIGHWLSTASFQDENGENIAGVYALAALAGLNLVGHPLDAAMLKTLNWLSQRFQTPENERDNLTRLLEMRDRYSNYSSTAFGWMIRLLASSGMEENEIVREIETLHAQIENSNRLPTDIEVYNVMQKEIDLTLQDIEDIPDEFICIFDSQIPKYPVRLYFVNLLAKQNGENNRWELKLTLQAEDQAYEKDSLLKNFEKYEKISPSTRTPVICDRVFNSLEELTQYVLIQKPSHDANSRYIVVDYDFNERLEARLKENKSTASSSTDNALNVAPAASASDSNSPS